MTQLSRQKISEKLQLMDKYIFYLEQLKTEIKDEKQFSNDFHLFGLAERYLQLSTQVIIDILNLIIIEEGMEKPENNQEIISVLFNNNIISENLASRLDGMVGFRNILVHEYGKIDKKRIYQYLIEKAGDFQIFKKEILKWLE